ncbi:hypothetical protein [Microbacterium allomyrinae]|jgi:hypothetical protein|uniref:Uncharacterized protein n=1 Tax=Microbacterium allomyrinae TaxID=2830666 RepID=A0A9X1LSV9_9MICO|nr:hypothetical protein [Microbacterium allomyrinae]MCC2031360.1 hypothetical protein [Microbacterium allomyrinae]
MAPTPDSAPRSTVVALVGAGSDELLTGLADVPALIALSLREADPSVATHLVTSASAPYVIHDADPLEHVAAAWVELYEERATLGSLEIEVETLLGFFASGEVVMPDYYVVAGPEAIEGTWRHWWLGALALRAPSRVLPVEASGPALRSRLRSLPTSRPWPDPATWLPHVQFDIPDRVGLRDQPGAA